MAKTLNPVAVAALAAVVLLGASCGNSAPSTGVLAGNLAYGRGQYQKAILYYLDAQDAATAGRDVIHYNLANVYFALGEGDAALRSWSAAEDDTDDADLLFRIAFNRGVLYYHRGRYEEAYRSFRRALEIRPSDIDAKVNLEESLSRVRAAVPQPQEQTAPEGDETAEENERLLDYIRRKEAGAWTAGDGAETAYAEDW